MLYDIRHLTRFTYAKPAAFARCNLRLTPIDWPGQEVISHKITVEPSGQLTAVKSQNSLTHPVRLTVTETVSSLDIVSTAQIRVTRTVPMMLPGDPTVAAVGQAARASHDIGDLSPAAFLYPSPFIPADPAIEAWGAAFLRPDRPVLEAALDLAQTICHTFTFDADATKTGTPPAEAFAARAGVCQDFAQIMICALRGSGVPAAYASGYIRTIPPPGQARLQGADAMHGWVLVWCGPDDGKSGVGSGRGWIGLDPTNGIFMAGDHIIVAVGRDYLDIAPVDGIVTGSGAQDVAVEVDVEPGEG
jgi:transglutaminase-like putative cysteine protease